MNASFRNKKSPHKMYFIVGGIALLICLGFILKPNNDLEKIETNNKNNSFATYIENEDGTYEQIDNNSFSQEGFIFNEELSYCEDLKGEKVANALSYKDSKLTLTSNVTTYCYVYFSKNRSTSIDYLINNNILWKSDIEGDGYRYIGLDQYNSDETPNNFVCFGTTDKDECKKNEDKYMYRMIGIFPDSEGSLHIKLIKLKQLENINASEIQNTNLNGELFLNNSNYDYLQNEKWLNKISDWQWHIMNIDEASLTEVLEWNSREVLEQELSSDNIEETLKIGLPYISDYKLASGQEFNSLNWIHQKNNDVLKNLTDMFMANVIKKENNEVVNNYPLLLNDDGTIIYDENKNNMSGIRPVFYLNKDTSFSDGIGSYKNPYIIND